MRKCTQFKSILSDPKTLPIMEAHNAMSAMIVEECGFKSIWASGLTMSASLGVRDCNELTWTQILDHLEFMNDSIKIPIIVDGDTGFGNFNIARRFIKKLSERGIASVCLEDKLFPKRNSFSSVDQELIDVESFCAKIKAGKDSQTHNDFSIIARTEALICGYEVDEALKRADAYFEAGADAILVHSKKQTADEIFTFSKLWHHKIPLIAVPTTYYQTPFNDFQENRISIIIWANQTLRASMTAMKNICSTLIETLDLASVNDRIDPVSRIFSLTNEEEIKTAEELYMKRCP
jgi:phosphoenolpyruvate mutase